MASTDRDAEIRRLQEQLAAQDERMRRLEQFLVEAQDDTSSRSRRDLLRMAGFTVAGIAAGGAALSSRPALAANPPLLLDQSNASTATTRVIGDASVSQVFVADGSANSAGSGILGIGNNDVGVAGQSTNGGAGVSGVSDTGPGTRGEATNGGDGVLGISAGGPGVLGQSSNGGTAVTGHSDTGLDLKAVGTGRLGLVNGTTVGSGPKNGAAPGYSPGDTTNELIPGQEGELWYGWTFDPASGTNPNTTYWRRLNSIRFDNGNGSGGLLVPYRAVDTRTGSPLPGGGTLTQGIAPIGQGVSAHGIPHTAIGVVGNLTAVSPNYSGFLTLFPAGGTNPALTATPTSTVNFVVDGAPTPNSFVVGLGGGAVSIYANNPGGGHSVHVLLDVTGYVE